MVPRNRLIGISISLSVFSLVSLAISMYFFSYMNPGDGVYYLSLSDSLIASGRLEDLALIPPHRVITYQNGIVYIVTSLKYLFNSYWIFPYTLLVAGLWSAAFYFCYRLIYGLFQRHFPAILFLAINLFQIEFFVYSLSFYNESVYNPLLLLFCTFLIEKTLTGSGSGIQTVWPPRNSIQLYLLYAFLILGVFFRNQHVIILMTLTLYIAAFDRKRLPEILLVDIVSALLLFMYISDVGSDKIKEYVTHDVLISKLNFCTFSFIMNQFIFYINPQRLFGSCKGISFFLGGAGLLVFAYGLWTLKERSQLILLILLYLSLNFVFVIFIAPSDYSDNRYTGIGAHFLILLGSFLAIRAWVLKFPAGTKVVISVLSMAMALCWGLILFFHLEKISLADTSKSYIRYTVVEDFKRKFPAHDYLIYAIDYRLAYWYLKEPICSFTFEPDRCAEIRKMDKHSTAVFVGDRNAFYQISPWALQYQIGESLVSPIGDWGVYRIFKKNNGESFKERP